MSDEIGPQTELPKPRSRRRVELIFAGAFALLHILAPFVIGERYPFTVAPMFRDQPSCYCVYEVTDSDGKQLDLEDFGLHLVYDGNPVGLGVGIVAKPTLHGFGEQPTEKELLGHVREKLDKLRLDEVIVKQKVVCCQNHVPSETVNTWTVKRERGAN